MRRILYFFSYLDDRDVEWLASTGKKATVPPGTVLIREDRNASEVIILLNGRPSVLVGGESKHEFAALQQGDIVGELSFLDSRPPNATVVVATESVILAIPRDQPEPRVVAAILEHIDTRAARAPPIASS